MRRSHISLTIAFLLFGTLALTACRNPASTTAPVESSATSPANARDRLLTEQWDKARRGLEFETASGFVEVERIAGGTPETAAEHLAAADELLAGNRIMEAMERYGLAARHDPDLADAYVGIGLLLTRKGEHAEAIVSFRTALDRDASHLDARYRLAMALWSSSEQYEAIDEMNRLATADDNHAGAHERLAVWHYFVGDFADAWYHLHRAEELGERVPGQLAALLSQRMIDPASLDD